MANADLVADGGSVLLVGSVNDGPVLNVDLVADANEVDVAAHHRIKPNGAALAHGHVAHHRAVGRQKGGLWNLGMHAANGQNKGFHTRIYAGTTSSTSDGSMRCRMFLMPC